MPHCGKKSLVDGVMWLNIKHFISYGIATTGLISVDQYQNFYFDSQYC